MALTVNPTLPVIAAQPVGGAPTGVVLQPGTVVSAQVIAAADNLVQIAIAGLTIDVLSQIPLNPGQNLQLAVSQADSGTIRLSVVGQGAAGAGTGADAPTLAPSAPVPTAAAPSAPNDPLTPLERIAVSVASQSAATEQESLGPLFANLNTVATSTSLPPALQQAVAQVLAQQTSLDPNLTGADIQTAFQKSGLFLEASLAAGATPPSPGVPDLKAALIVLRQTLAATVAAPETVAALVPAVAATPASPAIPAAVQQTAASPALAPSQLVMIEAHDILPPQARAAPFDEASSANTTKLLLTEALLGAAPKSVTSGAALNMLQEALQELPRAAGGSSTATVVLQDGRSADATVRTNTPPPPFRGALPSAQPVAAPSLSPAAPLATTVRHLLDDTDAALARQTLLQAASLPDRSDSASPRFDASMRWNFEIPFATAQGTAMAQFEIARDGGGNEVDPAKRVWRARFSLDVEPAGPVHVLIAYSGERTQVRMWAERPQTAAQLRAGAAELNQALANAELSPGDIVIRQGTPPAVQPAKAGHFLDRAL